MLGSRTKQINSYGKRNQRIVNVSEDRERKHIPSIFDDMEPVPLAPIVSKMKKREHIVASKSKSPSPKVVRMHRKKRLSSAPSPTKKGTRVAQIIEAEVQRRELPSPKTKALPGKKIDIPPAPRAPLASYTRNAPGSPAVFGKAASKAPVAKGALLKPNRLFSPFVDVDIVVLDDGGKVVKKDRRVSRKGVDSNPVKQEAGRSSRPSRRKHIADDVEEEDSGFVELPKRPKRSNMRAAVTLYSDDESASEDDIHWPSPRHSPRSGASSSSKSRAVFEIVIPPAPCATKKKQHLPPRDPSPVSGPRRGLPAGYSDDFPPQDDALLPPPRRTLNGPTPLRLSTSSSSKASASRARVKILVPPAPYAIKKKESLPPKGTSPPPIIEPPPPRRYPHIPSPAARPRQLTPIRRRDVRNPFEPPSPPSPLSSTDDFDLSLDYDELDIGSPPHLGTSYLSDPEVPEYLRPLLDECGQADCGPIDFSSFIETFPYDPVVRLDGTQPANLRFRKIGEASYSEVFGIGDVVLKVIPLRDECGAGVSAGRIKANMHYNEDGEEEDGPAPSDAKDVLKEVVVTRAMGEMCEGFVKLLKSYVIRGKYPEVLLRLWDEYLAEKGSESVRPDNFLVSQMYAIIVLPNGGPDLEAYKFANTSKMGWRQASSLFWQVAKTLARAEHLVSFEHRDLHLGQILVKNLSMPDVLPLRARNQNERSNARSNRVYMDDPIHGVRATLIDLGLSRMDAGDGHDAERVHWTPFEEEVFMGEGDYQFDLYRMMKEHNNGAWEEFKPFTNVMWLHYLLVKLLRSKRLKAPAARRSSPTAAAAAYSEKDCYDCLVDIESWVGTCVATFAPPSKPTKGKGRRKAPAPSPPKPTSTNPACAGEIVEYAVKKGWIQVRY
ncbi:hypothetical protein DXG03_000219 [Asterophora parasitica]|uniref:non-specific serine/threonine protein kinase n=1 Tax=Asterophora parasitica TaxID=117018 RepID=A0A9P7KHJ7_9AGAR|nr:hypothetical protein DXG03_000219 [Asterophora parasitica]